MRSRIRTIGVAGPLAAIFTWAWHMELWLIVVTMAASALTLVASERLGDRAAASRAAAWALYAPWGTSDPSGLEETLLADLATAAVGDTRLLDEGVTRAQDTITDPWVRALATERLSLAKHLVNGGDLPPPPQALNTLARRGVRRSAIATTLASGLLAALTGQRLLLVPVTAGLAAVGVGFGEARRRQGLALVLCAEASTAPAQGPIHLPEAAVIAALGTLTSSRGRVLAAATALACRGEEPRRTVALSRLSLAALSSPDRPPPSLTGAVLSWVAVTIAAIAVIEAM